MRRRPLLLVLYLAPFIFLVVPSRVRDALEVAVDAALGRARHPFSVAREVGGHPPASRPAITALRQHEIVVMGRDRGAHVVQLRSGGGRSRLVIDRGADHGVRCGDLAVLPGAGGEGERLLGSVDGVAPAFARIRTLADPESWWLARTAESRFVLQAGEEPERGLVAVRPEHRMALERAVEEGHLGVVTAADDASERAVPEGLVVGQFSPRGTGDVGSWRVHPAAAARSVLALRLQRGAQPLRFAVAAAAANTTGGEWFGVRVDRGRDGDPWRESVVVTRSDGAAGIPLDAPVARGVWLEGWVHTAAGASARVRLAADPGFYAHVLVLGVDDGRLVNRGGGVFRGAGRGEDGIRGQLTGSDVVPRAGDLIVVGPHKGAGGVGLLLGEVAAPGEEGRLMLRRPVVPAVGTVLWVGRFARPPERFPEDEEAAS